MSIPWNESEDDVYYPPDETERDYEDALINDPTNTGDDDDEEAYWL